MRRAGALVVVGNDLRGGDARGVDFAVDEEGRNARVLGLLHGGNGGVSAGVVENDGFAPRPMAVSIIWDCLLASSSWVATSVS